MWGNFREMIRDEHPSLPHLENWAMLLAEHGLTAPPHVISAAWIEWFAFLDRLPRRPKTIDIHATGAQMSVGICRSATTAQIEAELNDDQREALRLARANGKVWILGRDPNRGAYVYFPKGYC
jgi:hypothetical protein